MSQDSSSEIITQSREGGTGRGVLTTLLQRNAIVALGAAFVNPVLGFLGRRRSTPTQIDRLKLESYHSRPMPPPTAPNRRRNVAEAFQKRSRSVLDGCRRHSNSGVSRASSSHAAFAGKGGN